MSDARPGPLPARTWAVGRHRVTLRMVATATAFGELVETWEPPRPPELTDQEGQQWWQGRCRAVQQLAREIGVARPMIVRDK